MVVICSYKSWLALLSQRIFEAVYPGNADRLRFMDAYQLFEAFDYKNTLERDRQIVVGRNRLDNRPLDGSPVHIGPQSKQRGRLFRYDLTEGGFQSFDGMHPSGLGYGLIAAELMEAMGLPHSRPDLLAQSYGEDRLLTNFMRNFESIYGLVSIADYFLAQPDDIAMEEPEASPKSRTLRTGMSGRTENSLPAVQFIQAATESVSRQLK